MYRQRLQSTLTAAVAAAIKAPSSSSSSLAAATRRVSMAAEPHLAFRNEPVTTTTTTTKTTQSSPFATTSPSTTVSAATVPTATKKRSRKHAFVPRIAAVQLTDKARTFFKALLAQPPRPEIIGVMLNYDQSKTGEPRMVFSFSFVTASDIAEQDEGVSLELVERVEQVATEDGSFSSVVRMVPKSPADSRLDGLPKLYVHHNAFLKVLGSTVDVDTTTVTPILYDRENNRMDPNA